MKVQAAPGLKVPREDNPRQYITDAEPVELEMTGYYIRRMSDGDLLEVKAPEQAQGAPEQPDPTAGATSAKKR